MSQERSVRFSGKLRQVGVGLVAIAALTATGMVLVGGSDDSHQRARSELSPSTSLAAAPSASSRAVSHSPPARTPVRRAAQRQTQVAARAAAGKAGSRPMSEERARLVETARRELEQLEVQEPTNFLAIFDMMREEDPNHEKALEAGRGASHAYILARMRILEGMLRRFIDDPDGDRSMETDALARVDADFQRTIDSLARDVPSMANIQEVLTTTMLKAPAFTDLKTEAN